MLLLLQEGQNMEIAVEMSGITMRFPAVLANDSVDFMVQRGEVHALVGENGAGKTTLMNILYGLYAPTAGQIKIWGKEQCFNSAIDAIRLGIGMVHQHFMLIPSLSIVDNISLGEEPRRGVVYRREEAVLRIKRLCAEYEISLDPQAVVSDVSLGTQQRIEIMKALYRQAEIIILDEPTAVLTPQEIDDLGVMLKKLKSMGKTIIIITHKLKEVIDFSDRVTVLRRGKIVSTVNTKDTTADEITTMMVGRSVHLGGNKTRITKGVEVLRLDHVHYHDGRIEKLKDVSLTIHSGEILGIAGIDNSGQKELTEVIAGVRKPDKGSITLNGQELTGKTISDIKEEGVGFIPQDRQISGLALGMSIQENLIMGYHRKTAYRSRKLLLDKAGIGRDADSKIKSFDIRPDHPEILARTLSGGNQQKIVVSREISNASQLIIADQPSRGVDIGATELIHQKLVEARNSGMAVLLVSLELDEVMLLSDRIAVIYDGQIMGVLDSETATREQIGLMMAGVKMEEGADSEK